MAQKDPDEGPSLELPSLFGRRKRRTGSAADSSGDATTRTETVTDTSAPPDAGVPGPAEPPDAPVDEAPDHTAVIPVVEEPVADEAAADQARQEPAEPVAPAPALTPPPVPTATPAPAAEAAEAAETTPPTAPSGGRRARRARTGAPTAPEIGTGAAAFLVGAAVGLLGCALTYLGLQGCEVVTGVGSCGGPGLLVLVVILIAMVLAGAAALRWLRVGDAGSLSFLGVGMLTVIVLLFLIDYLYDPWMFLVIPCVTAVTFGVAHWITTRYTEDIVEDDDDNKMPHHDIR